MFGFIEGLTKTVIKTAVGLPIAAVADVATLGGELNDRRNTYTGDMLDSIGDNINKMIDD